MLSRFVSASILCSCCDKSDVEVARARRTGLYLSDQQQRHSLHHRPYQNFQGRGCRAGGALQSGAAASQANLSPASLDGHHPAKNLSGHDGRIARSAGVAAQSEELRLRALFNPHHAMRNRAALRSIKNYVAARDLGGTHGLDPHRLAVANRRMHGVTRRPKPHGVTAFE